MALIAITDEEVADRLMLSLQALEEIVKLIDRAQVYRGIEVSQAGGIAAELGSLFLDSS